MTIVRRFRSLTSQSTANESDDYVLVSDAQTESSNSNPVSPEHAQMLLFNEFSDFAEKFPYLFRMCTNVPTEESAENFVQILPLMLKQRDKIIDSSGTQMKSATEAIIEKLHDTYVAPHGINRQKKAVGGGNGKKNKANKH